MLLKIRVNGENPQLVATMNQQGLTAKLVRGGVIVELKKTADCRWDEYRYEIPEQLEHGMLFLEVTEHGGGMTNTGTGTIVCGSSGQPLKPYYVPRSGSLACGTHAYFSVKDVVYEVTGDKKSRYLTIKEFRVVREAPGVARIQSLKLWEGRLNELPNMFAEFEEAAKAALEKANCYHCREPHFVAQ